MMSLILVVSKFLNFEMMSLMNADSCSLFGAKDSFDIWTISLNRGMTTKRGAWPDDNQDSGIIEWWSSSEEP